jgi:Zn-dependent protease
VTVNQRRARPWQDLLISLSGPAASFGLMFLSNWVANHTLIAQTDRMLAVLLPAMTWANLWWGIFNLIPVPPLDGGHATREFFRIFLTERNAFIVSIWIAIVCGSGTAVVAFLTRNFFIAFYIAWFVYLAFQQWQYFRQHGIPGD